jgi:class 3 adenylate cyclase
MKPATILVADDVPKNVKLLEDLLTNEGYTVLTAADGRQALEEIGRSKLDLVLLDVMMPGMNGYEVCKAIRGDQKTAVLPVVMVTSLDAEVERLSGLEAGADDFLSKPVNEPELLARVRSLLRVKQLYDRVQAQAEELAELNRTLEQRVQESVAENERVSVLKRFFSEPVARFLMAPGSHDLLKGHRRREIAVVFLDLRGFTAFSERNDPEYVSRVLREYHSEMGKLIMEHEGTIERFAGDGIMIFFNDPVEIPDPAARAVRMALAMQSAFAPLKSLWTKRGFNLDLGIGIAQGYATIGMIGFEGRWDYSAIGTVCNLAARLCGEAKGGQILIAQNVMGNIETDFEAAPAGNLVLKGFAEPMPTYAVLKAKSG